MKKFIYLSLSLILVVGLFKIDFRASNGRGCAFCSSEILQAQTFYEGERVLGLLTHKPAAYGHVLILPKRHVERFEDLTKEEYLELSEAIKKIDLAVRESFGNKDYFLLQKNGVKAGQNVPHVHFHYLPAVDFLTLRFFLSPWLKPLKLEELTLLKETLSESLSKYTDRISR